MKPENPKIKCFDCAECRTQIEQETRQKCWEDLEKSHLLLDFRMELHYMYPQGDSICTCNVCRLRKLKKKWRRE